jgi:gamma-glutamyltranspeptidase
MGGRAQPQIHTQVALHLTAGRSVGAAVSAPRWLLGHMEVGADEAPVVQHEQDVPDEAVSSLAATGVPTEMLPRHDDGVGHAQVIRRGADGLDVATDPRADGAALTDAS